MNAAVFRAYDIRGVADRDLTDLFVTDLGRAFGTLVRRTGGDRVAVGRDCRASSPRLFAALTAGIRAVGVDVLDVGVVPSPLLYWSVFNHRVDGGVIITGSHNPAPDNGFKLLLGQDSIHGAAVQHLRELIETRDFAEAASPGALTTIDVHGAYVDDVCGRLRLGPRRLRVVVDGGNGTGGPPAVALLGRLGVDLVPLHVDMDGSFPNHHPDPTVEANLEDLRAAVLAHGADLGVAYDGDADRIGVIDDRGDVLWGDRLMILLAREILRVHPHAAIVGEVKCSKTLFEDILFHGGRPVMGQVGHSLIKARMKAEGAQLAGEMSGHIFFRDRWYGFDDAIYVTGRLLEILSHGDASLSERLADVPHTHVTPEIRLDCPDELKFALVDRAVAHFSASHEVITIDGARVDFGDGWGLIRASNTQPVIVLRAEADSPEALARIRATLTSFILS